MPTKGHCGSLLQTLQKAGEEFYEAHGLLDSRSPLETASSGRGYVHTVRHPRSVAAPPRSRSRFLSFGVVTYSRASALVPRHLAL